MSLQYLIAIGLLGSTLLGCGEPSEPLSLEERAAAAEDGSIRLANRTPPGREDFEPIGTPFDSVGELTSYESCFASEPITEPVVTPRFASQYLPAKAHWISTDSHLAALNWMVPPRFSIEDPVSQFELEYLASPEWRATIYGFTYTETAYVSVDWASNHEALFNERICGTEADPITLDQFTQQCGDEYAAGKMYGAFVWVFATHPSMSEDDFEAVVEGFEREERGDFFADASNVELLVDLGFDVRVYSYGLPESVADPAHEPGGELTGAEVAAYYDGETQLRERFNVGLEDDVRWPHDHFGSVLEVGRDIYDQDDIEECTGLGPDTEARCYARAVVLEHDVLDQWREFHDQAEHRLAVEAHFDWGDHPEAMKSEYRDFIAEVQSCLQRSQGLLADCRAQIEQTPGGTQAICDRCAYRFNCQPSSADAGQCLDDPDRERFECAPGAFENGWDRLSAQVRDAN